MNIKDLEELIKKIKLWREDRWDKASQKVDTPCYQPTTEEIKKEVESMVSGTSIRGIEYQMLVGMIVSYIKTHRISPPVQNMNELKKRFEDAMRRGDFETGNGDILWNKAYDFFATEINDMLDGLIEGIKKMQEATGVIGEIYGVRFVDGKLYAKAKTEYEILKKVADKIAKLKGEKI